MESLNDIVVFVQVVESGSFTEAAERLGLSKAAVSKYVTRLEKSLGARLLNRTTRTLSLTEVGQVFYTRSCRGLSEINEATTEVSRLQGAPRGTLKISAPMSFGILHVVPAIAEFQSTYTDVKIDMQLNDRKVDLIQESFDLAIRITNMPESSLVARKLASCRHVICASPKYLERCGVPKEPADLRNHSIVNYKYQASGAMWEFTSETGEQTNVAINSFTYINNSLAIRETLVRGLGIARIPTFVVSEDIRAGRLTALLTDFQSPVLTISLVYPHRKNLSPKVRAFLDFMVERIDEPPYWDKTSEN